MRFLRDILSWTCSNCGEVNGQDYTYCGKCYTTKH